MDKILIIDDEKAICTSLTYALEDKYIVAATNTVDEGLEILEQENIQVVLLDLLIGAVDGLEVLRHLRSHFPQVVVMIMTAYGSISSSVEAMKEGAFHYLTKPIDMAELQIMVDKAIEYANLQTRLHYLSKEVYGKYSKEGMVSRSKGMEQVLSLVEKVKDIDSTVLITGESGTGKELIAKALHFQGRRKIHRLEVLNCAAIPTHLLESELFGYEKGAFTGATRTKPGRFQMANGGTLFLDEIGEMDLALQAKLLRFLQDKAVSPLGSNKSEVVDVRVIAATNRDLKAEVAKGSFREDLFFRLNVINVSIPPLRERKEDIPLLVEHFIKKFNQVFNKRVQHVPVKLLELLEGYNFPGNNRELENIIERAVALSEGEELKLEDLPEGLRTDGVYISSNNLIPIYVGESMRDIEKKVILQTLAAFGENRVKTAEVLGISERNLRYKIKEYKQTN
ncbi:MAG: sigma-54 dependent transcriptional regulator [Bacillota bacterium]|nr:sigma-54 dependent transcriptional regulator [Bacillota bacterium]